MSAFDKMPAPPQDASNEAVWQRAMHSWLKTLFCHGIVGGKKISHPEGGYSLIVSGGARGTPPEPITVERYILKEVWPNTLRCHTWNGTTEGSEDVYVAKPTKLRKILSTRIDGLNIGYTYDQVVGSVTRFQFRTATATGKVPENQIVVPRYLTEEVTGQPNGDEIWAVELSSPLFTETDPDISTATEAITWLDLNVDGRAWAKQFPP